MPFTLAHPAAVIPLARRSGGWLPLSALVVGSMAPDFEYFATLKPARTISHDLIGIPLLCVPTGLLVLWVYQHLMKRPLIDLLPGPVRRRLWDQAGAIPFFPLGRLATILNALAIGTATHLVWDSITHQNGWFVERFPVLSTAVLVPWGRAWKVFDVLQLGSSVSGLGLLGAWFLGWWRRGRVEALPPDQTLLSDRQRSGVWLALMVVPSLTALAISLSRRPELAPLGLFDFIVRLVLAWISTFLVVGIGLSLAYRFLNSDEPPVAAPRRGTPTRLDEAGCALGPPGA